MSNNIYDILKKFNNLDSVKTTLTESAKECKVCGMKKCKCEDKKHESKKKDKVKESAIAEAVAQVEQQLNEKYMGFKKTAAAVAKGGSAKDPEAVAAAIGRKKYGKEKFQKAAAAGKKLGEGTIQEGMHFNNKKGCYVWDDDTGRVDKEDLTPQQLAKIKQWKAKNPGKKQGGVQTGERVPYGSQGIKRFEEGQGDANEDVLTPKQQKFAKLAPPPDKITYADKIAGAKKSSMKDEGNEFSGALAQAKAQHKDKFSVDGKTYPVKEGFPTVADAEKRMREKEGKTAHGKKTTTATGTKHERDYDAVDKGADVDTRQKGRGRPKKDRFA